MERVHPLRKWRLRNGGHVTLAEVGESVGVVPSYISDIERFEKQPSLTIAAKLRKLTGIPENKFLKAAEAAE